MDIKIPKMPNLDRLHELRMNAHWPLFTPGNSRSSCHYTRYSIYYIEITRKMVNSMSTYLI